VWLLAAAWNFALGPLGLVGKRAPRPIALDVVGLVAGIAFLALAVRELLLVVRVGCDSGYLEVRGGSMAPWLQFRVPIVDVVEVVVRPDAERAVHELWLNMRAGPPQKLPLNLEGLPLSFKGSRKQLFAAPPSHASFVASRVASMLERARHAGHETFRT
jgi:hypothetical protein